MRLLPDGRYYLAVGSTEIGNGSSSRTARLPRPCSIRLRAGSTSLMATPTRRHTTRARLRARGLSLPVRRWRRLPPRSAICSSIADRYSGRARPKLVFSVTRSFAAIANFLLPNFTRSAPQGRSLRRRSQGLSLAAFGRLQRSGRSRRGSSRDGRVMPLQSVHAADIGRIINPMQCRGKSMAPSPWVSAGRLKRWCLMQERRHGQPGASRLSHPGFRRRSAQRDLFRETCDSIGPLGAKAQGNVRSIAWRRPSPTRSPTRPACASPIFRSRPTAFSASSHRGRNSGGRGASPRNRRLAAISG